MRIKTIKESYSSSDLKGYTFYDAVGISQTVEQNARQTRGFISVETKIELSGFTGRNGEPLYRVLSTLKYDEDAPSRPR